MYKLIKIDPETWCYEDVMPDGDSIRIFVLNGEEKCLVIDSGFVEMDIKGMVSQLLESEGKNRTASGEEKEIILANTHGDGDHVGGNGSFEKFYITKTDYDNCGLKERFPETDYIPVTEGLQIDLGGRVLEYRLAPGHTYGNTVILDVTNRVLFPGDIVQNGTIFMFGDHRNPAQLEESLNMVIGMKDEYDKIFASHGQMVLDPSAAHETLKAWKMVLNKEVEPVKRKFFDTDVDMYCCGFCNFFYNG